MASPWTEGVLARTKGEGDHQNPYPRRTDEWCGWLDGWIDQDDHLQNRVYRDEAQGSP